MRFLILLLLPLALAARDVRLLRIEAPEDAPSRVFVVRGEVAFEMDVPRLSPSRARLRVGAEAARLRLALERPTRERPLPADAPSIDLPAGEDDLLVVLFPREGAGALAVQGLPVALTRDPARAGAFLWMNLSDRTLLVRFGPALTAVPPGQGRLAVPPVAPGGAFPVLIDLAARQPADEPQPMVRATWTRHDSGRQLMFVLPDAERVVPRIVSVPDVEPPAAPPGPEGRPGDGSRVAPAGPSPRR